jgi:hypothetical protein
MNEYELSDALTRAWARTKRARQMGERYKKERDVLQAQVQGREALVRTADALASVAAALPEVVKTRELRVALSKYRKEAKKHA